MKTYLLTWNPRRWDWRGLYDSIREIQSNGETRFRWSTGVTKSIRAGDRIFLIKLGKSPKGIIGSGFAVSFCYEDPHWKKNSTNAYANYVQVVWDILSDEPIISDTELNLLPDFNWFPQSSGVTIRANVSAALEKLWKKKTKSNNDELISDTSNELIEGEQRISIVTYFERDPEARRKCLKIYGLNCAVCNFNFAEFYGNLGENYIHVHHLKPLSTIRRSYKINPIKDLIPICPNCHVMIHKTIPPKTLNQIKALVNKQRKENK